MLLLPTAGVFTESLTETATTLLALTGLLGGSAHYGAILARSGRAEVAYTRKMLRGIAIVGSPPLLILVLAEVLDQLDAGPGLVFAAVGLVATISGAALGYFADKLPGFSREPRRRSNASRRAAPGAR